MVKPGLSTLHIFSFGISISLDFVHCYNNLGGFPDDSVVKNSPASAGDMGSISESGRSSGEGNVNPLQYSCLGNPIPLTQRSLVGCSPGSQQRVRQD